MISYESYRDRLRGIPYPYACLDMELLDTNIKSILARANGKSIRLASKSIRCKEVMRYILAQNDAFQGLMTYHGREVLHLSDAGFDDLLMGYPVVERELIAGVAQRTESGQKITLMVDSTDHVDLINEIGREYGVSMSVCIDIDMSMDVPGLHFGVWRSSIRTIQDLDHLLKHIAKKNYISVDALMGYEAQIAGVTDDERRGGIKNSIKKLLKKRSLKRIAQWRQEAVDLIRSYGHTVTVVNGGGTGSMETTCAEDCVTEVTVGSGFYNSHLFDNYQSFQLQPALFYGIPVVREPVAGVYTCHEGGYIASGVPEGIKAPIVHLPKSGYLDALEGAGEVQTPVRFRDKTVRLGLGDPVYLRHAKAGELCERFDMLYFLRGDEIVTHHTYRGHGLNFG